MEVKSLREAIGRVRGNNKWNSSDTYTNVSDRYIASELESTALAFIKQATDKRMLWNSANIFTPINCLQLKKVPLSECCSYTSPCEIARSVYRLPKIAEGTKFGMLIQGVYSIDGLSRKFIESSPDRFANSKGMNLQTKQIHYWIQDKYLYLSDPNIEKVKILAYFEEDIPIELQSYPSYCKESRAKGCCPSSTPDETTNINDMSACCPPNPYDMEFKCPGYMVDAVIKEVQNKILGGPKRSADDKTNDSKDDTK